MNVGLAKLDQLVAQAERLVGAPRGWRTMWLIEHDAALSIEWSAGTSCSTIASILSIRFGLALTKNAIIGRVHRLKLIPRRVVTPSMVPMRARRHYVRHLKPAMEVNPPDSVSPEPPKRRAKHFAPPDSGTITVDMKPPLIPPGCKIVSILEVGSHECRAIIGGQGIDTMFCGGPTVAGGSWCVHHRALFYQPATLRKAAA